MSALAVLSMATATLAPAHAGTLDAKAGWMLLKQCATQADDAARHACTDDVLRRAGLLAASGNTAGSTPASASAPVPAPAAAAVRAAAPLPAAATDAGAVAPSAPARTQAPANATPATPAWYTAAAPAAPKSATSATAREPGSFQVVLTAVQTTGDGKLLLTTADGAIWKQTESQTLSAIPQQGQAMTIKRKSLGSFMCEPGRYVSFRCYRVR